MVPTKGKTLILKIPNRNIPGCSVPVFVVRGEMVTNHPVACILCEGKILSLMLDFKI